MSFKLIPATIVAIASLVVTLDRHPFGAAALVVILLAGGIAIAIARHTS